MRLKAWTRLHATVEASPECAVVAQVTLHKMDTALMKILLLAVARTKLAMR